jgi:hypothetical protein
VAALVEDRVRAVVENREEIGVVARAAIEDVVRARSSRI